MLRKERCLTVKKDSLRTINNCHMQSCYPGIAHASRDKLYRERDRASCALPWSANQFNAAAMCQHCASRNTETKSGATLGTATRFVHPIETVEHVRQVFAGDPDAGILDVHDRLTVTVFHLNRDASARGRVLDGIVQNIEENLAKPQVVARYACRAVRVERKMLPLAFSKGPECFRHLFNQMTYVDGFENRSAGASVLPSQSQKLIRQTS